MTLVRCGQGDPETYWINWNFMEESLALSGAIDLGKCQQEQWQKDQKGTNQEEDDH